MKTILLGDLHFDAGNGNKEILERQLSFFENQLFPYMEENGITQIFQTGDFFDNRVSTDTYVLNEVCDRLFEYTNINGIEWIVILGNHDLYHKTNRNYSILNIIDNTYPNIRLIRDEEILKLDDEDGSIIQFVPWLLKEEQLIIDKHANAVFGHFEFKDFYMSKTYKATHGIDVSTLRKDVPIISGHYHNKQKKGNINYLGTPYQLSWSDYQEEKGFYVYEGDWSNLTFIENSDFKHLKVDLDVDTKTMNINGLTDELELKYRKGMNLDIFKGNKVKVYAKKELAIVKTIMEALNEVAYKVDLEILKEHEELDTDEILEKVKDYDITDSLISVVEDGDVGLLNELIDDARNNMKEM